MIFFFTKIQLNIILYFLRRQKWKKIKRIISGALGCLALLGLLKGCSELKEKKEEETNSSSIEIPVDENEEESNSIIIEIPAEEKTEKELSELKSSLEEKIKEFNNENINIEYNLALTINDIDINDTEINYELLNEIIALYSQIEDNFKKINYYPHNIYNIDFNYVNLKDLEFQLIVDSSQINKKKVIPALECNISPSLIIRSLKENDISSLLDILEIISKKNGNVSIIMNTTDYNEDALNELTANMKKEWHFNYFSIISDNDFSSLISKINANSINLQIRSSVINFSYKINEGTKNLTLSFGEKTTTPKNIYLEIPDSLEKLYVDYTNIDALRIADIKNAYLNIKTYDKLNLKTFIELGYFEYPKFTITDGLVYTFKKDASTEYKIELAQSYHYIGEVKLQKDVKGDVTGLSIIVEEKNKTRILTRTKSY